eukprot:CAMPEP_0172151814 /NCGR_PEP_ID=MMETSP1050-20130122/457_1 /TAXON_ID=233186 /ORGANISM="Cryptomonas curvata, Strain CCAP979/52" /LENGTH=83 /DNA_ID=CAMNT_0012819999 /DNA_START=106 /DNA_END=353 /DNA_ORIENTATION=+
MGCGSSSDAKKPASKAVTTPSDELRNGIQDSKPATPRNQLRLSGTVDRLALPAAPFTTAPAGILSIWLLRGEDLRASPADDGT